MRKLFFSTLALATMFALVGCGETTTTNTTGKTTAVTTLTTTAMSTEVKKDEPKK